MLSHFVEYKQEKEPNWVWKGYPEMTVHISREHMMEIFAYVDAVDTEISGLGDVEVDLKESILKITKLRMFQQECTGSETTIKPEQLDKLNTEAVASGDDLSKLRFWWHSHANMTTFWSTTDVQCIDSLLSCFNNYCLSIVVNKKRDLLARLDIMADMMSNKVQLTHHMLKVVITDPIPEELTARIRASAADLVSKPVYKPTENFGNHYGQGSESSWYHRMKDSKNEPFKTGIFLKSYGWVNPHTMEKWDWVKREWVAVEVGLLAGMYKEKKAFQEHTKTDPPRLLPHEKDKWQCAYCDSKKKISFITEANEYLCKWCARAWTPEAQV